MFFFEIFKNFKRPFCTVEFLFQDSFASQKEIRLVLGVLEKNPEKHYFPDQLFLNDLRSKMSAPKEVPHQALSRGPPLVWIG
jgi:hypothetical protein